jgi:hypothetical protein
MNGEQADIPPEEVLDTVAGFLYGSGHSGTTLTIEQIRDQLPALSSPQIEDALQRLDDTRLLRVSINAQTVELLASGKVAFELGCVPEMVLGEQYVIERYADAVVHVIVQTREGNEAGGTGFFAENFPGWLITAAHVANGTNTVLRVESRDGSVICEGQRGLRMGPEELDLILVSCPGFDCPAPLRIDWRENSISQLDKVLIFGYPPFAGHEVDQFVASGQINSKPKRLGQERQSLIISGNVRPGCSGGPVVNDGGLVVGVVAEDVILDSGTQRVEHISAIPSRYLAEIPR